MESRKVRTASSNAAAWPKRWVDLNRTLIPLVEEDSAARTCGTRPRQCFTNGREPTTSVLSPFWTVSYTHLRAHETRHDLVCRLLLEKKKKTQRIQSL